jgi:hypothetical protein
MFLDSSLDVSHTLPVSGTLAISTNELGTALVSVTEEVSGEVALFLLTAATLALVKDSGSAIVVSASPTSGQIGVSLVVNSGTANTLNIKTGSSTTGTFRVDVQVMSELKGTIIS